MTNQTMTNNHEKQQIVLRASQYAGELGFSDNAKDVFDLFFCDCDQEKLKNYTQEVNELLAGLRKLDGIGYEQAEASAEDIRKMFFAVTKDIRVVFLKLCLVLAELEVGQFDSPEKKQEFAAVVLDLFAPLAGRLGLSAIKSRLEDRAFAALKPNDYKQIEKEVLLRFKERETTVEHLKALVARLAQELGIKATIMGRKKHIFSIYKKLLSKKSLSQIFDLVAVRAIVDDVAGCYALLGKIHGEVVPIQNRFKDYIAIPKSNGYQSLHTTLWFEGVAVEVQIRTHDMHRQAEYGLAAHWMYKEKRSKVDDLDGKLGWIRELLDKGDSVTKEELLSSLKIDIYDGEIFVQTPKGKVLHMQAGSTPIDFAYMIHSEVGNKCVGARVNGKMVPTTTALENGDVVEIITNPQSKGPSRDWLKFVKSSEAKSKINNFFKKEMKEANIKLGKDMLDQAIKDKGYSPAKVLAKDLVAFALKKYNFAGENEFLAAIGYGSLSAKVVAGVLITAFAHSAAQKELQNKGAEIEISKPLQTAGSLPSDKNVFVEGVGGLSLRFAKCCKPMEGDDIVGFLAVGRGIVIHRSCCANVLGFDQERLINAAWKRK